MIIQPIFSYFYIQVQNCLVIKSLFLKEAVMLSNHLKNKAHIMAVEVQL